MVAKRGGVKVEEVDSFPFNTGGARVVSEDYTQTNMMLSMFL